MIWMDDDCRKTASATYHAMCALADLHSAIAFAYECETAEMEADLHEAGVCMNLALNHLDSAAGALKLVRGYERERRGR